MLRDCQVFILPIVIFGFGMQGCMESAIRPDTQARSSCIGGPAKYIAGFKLNVSGFRWVDQVIRAGMENYPTAQMSSAFGSQVYLKPQLSFLAVNLNITNTSNRPLAWNYPYGFGYQLVNAQGTTYDASPEASNFQHKTLMGNLNPGVRVEGTVVFDVPKGEYTLTIVKNQLVRASMISRTFGRSIVFQCSLGS